MARYQTLAAALASTACIIGYATPAVAQQRQFNIPAGSLKEALDAFVVQSGTQLIYQSDKLGSAQSGGASGSMSSRAALDSLLKGSGFKAVTDKSGALAIVQGGPQGNALAGAPNAGGESASSEGEGVTSEGQQGVSEILVIGSRSQNVDIRRTENDPQPYVVFDQEQLAKSNATNLEEFFRTRVPMNLAGGQNGLPSSQFANVVETSNVSSINLRGLGANQTLILIDGRRAPRIQDRSTGFLDFRQGDINGIPISSIERIEILPSTAGAIYGGGAVGGVVNIIRKRNYHGLDVRLGFEGTFRGGGEQFSAEVSGGISPNGGRTQITFSASHSAAAPLYVGDNDMWRKSRELYATNSSLTLPLRSYTTNIRSLGGSLVLTNGVPLNSDRAYIPVGFPGIDLNDPANVAALVATAGQQNIDLADDASGTRAALRRNPRVHSANLNISHELDNTIKLFSDISFNKNASTGEYLSNPSAVVFAGAAGNPFRQTVFITWPGVGIDPVHAHSETNSLGITGGVVARLGRGWAATAEYDWSRAESRFGAVTQYFDGVTFNAAINNGSFNPFRDLNAYPQNFGDLLPEEPGLTRSGPFVTRQSIASARASGPVADLGGGKLNLTALLEHRVDNAEPAFVTQTSSLKALGLLNIDRKSFAPARQRVTSIYAELVAPIISERNAKSFVASLEVQASIRHDRYETKGAAEVRQSASGPAESDLDLDPPVFDFFSNKVKSTNYTIAAKWAPFRDIIFRGSYATGFLPPSISQIARESQEIPFPVLDWLDPKRNNEPLGTVVSFTQYGGGNPSLQPEKSRSLSVGVIVEPSAIRGLRLSVDYSRIKKNDEIVQTPDVQFILNHEDSLLGRVVRGAPVDGLPSPVISIDVSALNFSRSEVKALDIQADYQFAIPNFGDFHLYAKATRQLSFARQLLDSGAMIETVGDYSGPLAWHGNMGVDWNFSKVTVGWNAQYYQGYSLLDSDPAAADSNAARVRSQGGVDRIGSQMLHDLMVKYRFGTAGSSLTNGLELSAAVENVFDKKPAALASLLVLYSAYGDPRLRRYSLNLRKHF